MGNVSSKLVNGASGISFSVPVVIPALLMNVVATASIVTPSPCNTMFRFGNASPPWLTKYSGPSNGTGRIGVRTRTCPITDGVGHPAGFALNCAPVHAFCSVVNREGSCLGRLSFAAMKFA
jgi:hypothetical protein